MIRQDTNAVNGDYTEELSNCGNAEIDDDIHELWVELMEDAVWKLCYEVHRAFKFGYFVLKDSKISEGGMTIELQPSPKSDGGYGNKVNKNVKSRKKEKGVNVTCLVCAQDMDGTRYAGHFKKHLSKENGSQDSKKAMELDYEKSYSESGFYKEMTLEDLKEFCEKRCGAFCKNSEKLCKNHKSCIKHSKEEQNYARASVFEQFNSRILCNSEDAFDVDTTELHPGIL